MDIITGEKFQYLSDIYIGDKEFEPKCHIYNNTLQDDKCITTNNIQNNNLLQKSYIIFIYTHVYYKHKTKILNELSTKTHPFLIIFHNSDYIIDETFTEIFTKTKCKKIFAQNVCFIDKDIQYLPIGIANSKWKHGDLGLLNKIIDTTVIKEKNIFFNFSINTNYRKRIQCYNTIKNKGVQFTKYNNQTTYLIELKKCKFCISPDGNGPDCHRIWECLYLDVIPICKRSIFIENVAKDFPIYIVDDWGSLELNDKLYNSYDLMMSRLNKDKLQFSYWKNLIQS